VIETKETSEVEEKATEEIKDEEKKDIKKETVKEEGEEETNIKNETESEEGEKEKYLKELDNTEETKIEEEEEEEDEDEAEEEEEEEEEDQKESLPRPDKMIEWSNDDVISWLESMPKAAEYVEDFEIGEVDGDDLMNYSYSDLKNLGVEDDNDRRYLMKEIKKYNASHR